MSSTHTLFELDIVFFIFLYQRWIYRMDPKRVNEFGTTGEDSSAPPGTTPGGREGAKLTDPPITAVSDPGIKDQEDKKND